MVGYMNLTKRLICILVCVTYALYVVKEVVLFQGAWSINGCGIYTNMLSDL